MDCYRTRTGVPIPAKHTRQDKTVVNMSSSVPVEAILTENCSQDQEYPVYRQNTLFGLRKPRVHAGINSNDRGPGECNRTHVHRSGLPFLTVGVRAIIANMTRFKHIYIDIVTGDARNKANKKQLVQHPQVFALHMVMEGIVERSTRPS